jgi:radical SAM superfamily enzyme YgiQ (UPF0313 family)
VTRKNDIPATLRARLEREEGTLLREAGIRVALCYPSPYFVGMSSLGYQSIYGEINGRTDALAERAFLPDDVAEHERTGSPLLTVESQRPVSDFPILAFSVAYELELAGLFSCLALAGIPALREERGLHHPLVIAGGPLTFSNPAPLEPFVDVLLLGEAEDLVHTFLDLAGTLPREALLLALSKVPGFLVPSLDDGDAATRAVARAPDGRLPAYSRILTPDTELRSMFLIEPERGCSRGCHYCVMRRTTNGGMRTVPVERVLSLIPRNARRVGLVGAAVTDHPQITELLRAIVEGGREVGVSSLRADRLHPELVELLRRGGARGLTIASDGLSQRMRDLVDRKHSEAQLIRAAEIARGAGLERLKVYNLVGLPYETDADVDECVRLTTELSRILPVALGVSPFVAKRNTPLDGAPFAGIKEVEARLERLRRGLKGKAEVRPTSARWAWVEYMLAQGGPEAGLAAHKAWATGGSFAAYRRAFELESVKPFALRRTPDGRRSPTVWPMISSPAFTMAAQPG